MKTYYVSETQNFNSIRQTREIKAKNLKQAKTNASKNQMWVGTVLKIYSDIDHDGHGKNLITTKNTGFANTNFWIDE